MTLAERVAEWPKPYIRQGREEGIGIGREEGISIGREEGIAHERRLLRRLAAARFGVATADRLADIPGRRIRSRAAGGVWRGDCALRHGRRTVGRSGRFQVIPSSSRSASSSRP